MKQDLKPGVRLQPVEPRLEHGSATKQLGLVLGGGLVGAVLFYIAYASGSFLPIIAVLLVVAGGFVAVRVFPSFKEKIGSLWGHLRWWHGLWFLVYFSGLVFREGRDAQSVESSPLDAVALLRVLPEMAIALVLLVRLYLKRPPWLRSYFEGVVGAMGIYGVVCLTSTIWSVYRPWTLYKSGEYVIYIALLAAILQTARDTSSFVSILNLTWTISVLEMLWAWVQTVIWPTDAWDPWGRITSFIPMIAANGLGQSTAVVASIAACRLFPIDRVKRDDQLFYSLAFAFTVGTLIMTKTRNSIAGFLLAMVLMIVLSRRWRLGVVVATLAVPVVAFSGAGGVIVEFLSRGQTESEITGLSSRVDWWSFAYQQFMQHPFTGMGAYAGSRFGVLAKLGSDAPTSLHSDYIETIMGTSFLGLIPLLAAIGGAWWWLLRSVRSPAVSPAQRQLAYECSCIFAVTILHSFFNVEMIWQSPMTYLCILGGAEFIRRSRKAGEVGFSRSAAAVRS